MDKPSNPFFKIGNIIDDKWVIVEMIGKGGMAEVYRAHQINLKRDVAIKVISEEMLQSFEDDEDQIKTAFGRFQREVQAMAQVRHKNILQVFDYGAMRVEQDKEQRTVEYIVMEYIPGETLRYTMSEEGFEGEDGLMEAWLEKYFLPLLDGVEAIHQYGIVHRDLKPENVLMDNDTPKIADFGLARSFQMKAVSNSWDAKGTLAYMAPEQFHDFKRAGKTADIYALGKILYEAVVGTIEPKSLPFKSAKLENPTTFFFQQIDSIIQTATSERIESRYQSIDEFRKAVLLALDALHSDKFARGKDDSSKSFLVNNHKWIWAGITVTLLSLIAMTLWHILASPDNQTDEIKITSNGYIAERRISIETVKTSESILGRDGITMALIGESKIRLSSSDTSVQKISTIDIPPFYIDTIKVTAYHFTEFLNDVREELIVEKGVVKRESEIWYYLNAGDASAQRIIFEHNRFHLTEPNQGGAPIVRVTFYGAIAYAKYHGKRLLTEDEWRVAAQLQETENNSRTAKQPTMEPSVMSHDHMMGGSDRDHTSTPQKENEIEKRDKMNGPIDMVGSQVREWVIPSITSQKDRLDTSDKASGIAGRVIGYMPDDTTLKSESRHPWEGFPDVGFRTAVDLEDIEHTE